MKFEFGDELFTDTGQICMFNGYVGSNKAWSHVAFLDGEEGYVESNSLRMASPMSITNKDASWVLEKE